MRFLDTIWYTNHPLGFVLAPLGGFYHGLMSIRMKAYEKGLLRSQRMPVPVIVVGNLAVGGTGKTPLVIWLANFLLQQGIKPGIVSRGYKGKVGKQPIAVTSDSEPMIVGDEAILLARHSGCPVVVFPKRVTAAQFLLDHFDCNVILSDDGLQHYALHRDIEIAVIDDIRRHGNRRCLPAGPLREPLSRLDKVDFLVTKGAAMQNEFSMQYEGKILRNVLDNTITHSLIGLRGQNVHAIAGIGHPERFFSRLRDARLKVYCHAFPDHYFFKENDITFRDQWPVIMTEKDAVKCRPFAKPNHWYLPIEARLPKQFGERLLQRLGMLDDGQTLT